MDEDAWGCVIFALLLIGSGYWAYTHYEIRKRQSVIPQTAVAPPASTAPPRPTGIITLSTDSDGSIWKIDTDSIRGPRNARQGWVIIDASQDKTEAYGESRSLYQVDCDTTASRELSTATYARNGKNLTGTSVVPDKAPVQYFPPNTLGGHVVSYLCDPKFDNPTTAVRTN